MVKQNLSEEHKDIGKDEIKLSDETDDQKNKDRKVAALILMKNKFYFCNMCDKDFKSEKGLKGHMTFKHTIT